MLRANSAVDNRDMRVILNPSHKKRFLHGHRYKYSFPAMNSRGEEGGGGEKDGKRGTAATAIPLTSSFYSVISKRKST